ncbi:dermonecrotic toxin domain-containing protein [Pseudomonas triticicola]|uniref:Type III effector HopAS1 n=1 Tax=Pseudomonas triticicola TaxID=2842345 RepID=A0ABS6RRC4_9PSED|nr:hypothetical protein [Pseudomonas triticicola]MBV4548743.1 hypothetical protein [Pseudomonas triticicola]
MNASPPDSAEDALRQLAPCTLAIEHLLDAQPTLATVMASHLRKGLAALVPENPPDPDAVFLNEYVYDTPSPDAPDGAARVRRLTRTRNLTQVLHEAIVSQKIPTALEKEPPTGQVDKAVGFYPHAYDTGRDNDIAALQVAAVNTLIRDLQEDTPMLYWRALDVFWSSPHATTGALTVLEAVSQKQRVMFRLEADLKLHDARQQLIQAEQALQKKPGDKSLQTTADNIRTHLQVMTEGRQLIENLVLHETTRTATPAQVVSITLHNSAEPEWSALLSGCFIITERLHGTRPTVLYSPQFGVEVFEHFNAMESFLRRRLVADPEKTLLLGNVAFNNRTRAGEEMKQGQRLRYTAVTGDVFKTCLKKRRQQQDVEVDHALSGSLATFDALAKHLQTALALPLKGSPDLIARLPVSAEPTKVTALAHTLPDAEQQTRLIQQWNALNQQIGDVLEEQKHPCLKNALSSLLNETFPQLPADTEAASLYVTRYRTGADGLRQFESSRPLLEALRTLLLWENAKVPAEDGEAGPQAEADPVSEGVFSSSTVCDEAEQIVQNGSLTQLADALQARLTEQVRDYWQTPLAAELACPQARLIDLHRQALNVQACLRSADQTLSPQARLLIDRALRFPTLGRREAHFKPGARPGVYRVTVNTASAEGARLAGSFVLTSNDGSSPVLPHWPYGHKSLSTQGLSGSSGASLVVLYTPQQGFEELPNLQALRDRLVARINAGDEVGKLFAAGLPLAAQHMKSGLWGSDLRSTFAPIEDDFVADGIQTLLDKQQSDIDTLMGLAHSESDREGNARPQMLELLDMAGAFMARNRLLLDHWQEDWEKRLSQADRTALQNLARDAEEKQLQLSQQWKALVPTIAEYAKAQVLLKIRAFLAEKNPDGQIRAAYPVDGIDPDQTLVIRTTRTRVGAGMQSGFASVHESVASTRMSLTNLLLKNNQPWQKSLSWSEEHLLEATLTTSKGLWVRDSGGKAVTLDKQCLEQWVKELNIGHRYAQEVLDRYLAPQATNIDGQALQKAWIATQAATLGYAALSARLSPDAYSTVLPSDNSQKTAAAWVSAVLSSPDPDKRALVDGQAVIANALVFNPTGNAPDGRGGQNVNGVLILSAANTGLRVLYTPSAPDGMDLRELASETDLPRLMRGAWQTWLQARLPPKTRLLNHRLVACRGDVFAGLYRQNYLHLLARTNAESVTNEELLDQSRFNQVMFGIEVVTTVLGALPWSGPMASSAMKWLGGVGRSTVSALRSLGQNVAGLIVRRGAANRTLIEVATATTQLTGAARATGIGIKPLQLLIRPAKSTTLADLTGYQKAFLQENSRLAVAGGIPAGSSLAEGSGIYRTPSNTLLVRSTGAKGEDQVFRIQNSFNLYDPNGLVAPVLTPSGALTSFRLRRMTNQLWTLDTLNRLPGGAPKADSRVVKALREWDARITANAQSANPLHTLDPVPFFTERNIPARSWNKFVKKNTGEINTLGYSMLRPGQYERLTDELFQIWLSMNQPTREAAETFASTHRLHPLMWSKFVTKKGELTVPGSIRAIKLQKGPEGKYTNITDQHFRDWYQLSLQSENRNRYATVKFALDNNIHAQSWMKYVNAKGEFRMAVPTVAERVNRLGLTQNLPQAWPSGSAT